jgi:hypothetical protein
MCDRNEVELLVQDQMVRNAKDLVARRVRDWEYAAERLRYAKDALHDEEVRLIRMREQFLQHTI